MPLLRNAGSTKLLRNASSTDLVRSLDSSCPDPCDGCIPGPQSGCITCAEVTLSGVATREECFNWVKQAVSALNDNPVKAADPAFDGISCKLRSRDDFGNGFESLASPMFLHYRHPTRGDAVASLLNVSELDVVPCLDGRIRISYLRMSVLGPTPSAPTASTICFEYDERIDNIPRYLGDALPNNAISPTCVFSEFHVFSGGTATVTAAINCFAEPEPLVVKAYDCPTGLSDIEVRLGDNPDFGASPPYYPKNGGIVYKPAEVTNNPAILGTTWVQEACGDPIYPEAVRCDGLAGTVTYDPADRPPTANIFTTGGIDYTPSGGTSTTSPSSGVWSSGVCGSLLLATRCNSDDIPNVPGDVEAQIPANISYDSALLNGGLPEDFTIGMRLIVQRDMGGGLSQDFCLEIPYQCTNLPATGNELQSYQVQEIDCNSWGLGSSGQGALCDVGGPGGGLDCANICCPANGGDCDAEPWCGFCQCCWNVFPE